VGCLETPGGFNIPKSVFFKMERGGRRKGVAGGKKKMGHQWWQGYGKVGCEGGDKVVQGTVGAKKRDPRPNGAWGKKGFGHGDKRLLAQCGNAKCWKCHIKIHRDLGGRKN